MREKEKYIFGLSLLPDIGYVRLKQILSYFSTPRDAWEGLKKGGFSIKGIGPKIAQGIESAIFQIDIDKEFENIYRKGIKIITIFSDEYPILLKEIHDPPIVLYIKGSLPLRNYISVVGTRKPSKYGMHMAEKLSGELAERGATVVSGMARGIDTYAHIGALKGNGMTIAVLGSGVDVIYPYENKGLYQKIISSGAVVSEYPPGTRPRKEYFPRRNRIIAGLSLGTLVVEAPEKSGALITASFALSAGREVFAIPGRSDFGRFKGTNKLIKDGAKLVETVDDIIDEFPYIEWKKKEKSVPYSLTEKEEKVYSIIGDMPKYIDEIMRESKLSMGEFFSVVLSLELKGLIKEIGGKRYCKIK